MTLKTTRTHQPTSIALQSASTYATQLTALENIASVGIWQIELPTMEVTLSPRMASVIGSKSRTLPFQLFLDTHFTVEAAEALRKILQDAISEKMPFTISSQMYTRDRNRLVWMRETGEPDVDERGNLRGFFCVARQIETEMNLRLEISNLQAVLQRVQRDESTLHLAGSLAHEISNLLQPTLSRCEMLALLVDDLSREELRVELERIENGILRTSELVKTTLEFSKLETKDFQKVRVIDVVRDSATFIDAFMLHRIRFEFDRNALGHCFHATRSGAFQCIYNILKNAFQASPSNSEVLIRLQVETCGQNEKRLQLSIIDNGKGFSEEGLIRAFDPLFTTKSEVTGTGLGLTVVRTMVESWGGTVDLENTESAGACVELRIPITASINS